jgi:hypothetical protein
MLIFNSKAVVERRGFRPKIFDELRQVRVLVIDHETGDSNGVLGDRQFAKELVGDCWGKMSLALAEQFTSRTDTPIQFRLGIRPQEGNDHYRIAKGTLAPDGGTGRRGEGETGAWRQH